MANRDFRSAARLSRSPRRLAIALSTLFCCAGTWAGEDAIQMSDAVRSIEPSESVKLINEALGLPRNATAATNAKLAKSLFDNCALQRGDRTKLEPEEQKGFVYGISSEIFEKFDANCDGILNDVERARYFAAQHAALQDKLDENLAELEYQLEKKTQRSVAASLDRGVLEKKGADKIAPAVLTDTVSLSIAGGASSPPGAHKKSGKIEMKMATTPIKSFRTAYPTSLALDWTMSAGREQTRTATEKTRTDDVTFTPLSYKLMSPEKNWAVKFGIGGAYVWTDTRTLSTRELKEKDELTIAYVASIEYKVRKSPCFRITLDYEIKQRHFFSEKVSSKFAPGVTLDFMCLGREQRKAAVVPLAPGVKSAICDEFLGACKGTTPAGIPD